MNLFGECIESKSAISGVGAVCFEKSGVVSQRWLSACKEERALTEDLMEKVACPLNLMHACRKVISNAGSSGIDRMTVIELKKWFGSHYENLSQELLDGTYQVSSVRRVSIKKPKGGTRNLGIPTVQDRLVQQAIHQVLSPRYENIFSDSSYGFRPKRSTHQALFQAGENVKEGKGHIIDIDIASFFDEVNQDRLMWLLSTRVGDKGLLRLIRHFLEAGILEDGLLQQRVEGMPQGGPLCPLLSNIVLDELDKELERRELSFVRYADDCIIFCSSERASKRVYSSISSFINDRLGLRVNEAKSRICKGYALNYLGHSILNDGQLGLSRESESRFKEKIRQLTKRNKGISFDSLLKQLKPVMRGWLHYFRYAKMSSKLKKLDGWIRRRLRCFRLKQCKRVIGIVRFLRKLGHREVSSWKLALSGKGWWRKSHTPASNEAMNIEWFTQMGYYSLTNNYIRLQTQRNRRMR